MQAGIAVAAAGIVAYAAWRAGSLSCSGAIAAAVVGAVIFAAGGLPYAAVLFAFFVPSVLLSRIGAARKKALTDIGKSGARDALQVAANGGAAAVCALVGLAAHSAPVAAAFAGAFAAASADTWGTEIGTLAPRAPRSVLTLRPLATGLSGGVTAIGTLAEVAGACVVGLVAAALGIGVWWAIAAGGIVGAFVDSFIGASAQALRYCAHCSRSCETNPHDCGAPTTVVRGVGWMTNDAVNLCATLSGAAVSGWLALALTR